MPAHIHIDNLSTSHLKVDNNGNLITTGHEQLLYIKGVTSASINPNVIYQTVAIDTGAGSFTLTLLDPYDLDETDVVKEVRIVNVGDTLTQTGQSTKNIAVIIENNGEFFQNLQAIYVKPNESIVFALYKAKVDGVDIARWSIRSGVEFKSWLSIQGSGTVTTNNTQIPLTISSEEMPGLITIDNGNVVFNFDGQVEITTQYRVDPNKLDGSYGEVATTEKLNGVSLLGTGKLHSLKQDIAHFIQCSNERYVFRVKSGDVLTSFTSSDFNGRATLTNYRMLIKAYL